MMNMKSNFKLKFLGINNIPTYLMFTYFLVIITVYIKQNPLTELKLTSSAVYLLVCLGVLLISMLEVQKIKEFLQKKAGWINGFMLAVSPVVSFVMVETMVGNFNLKMFEDYSLYNIVWYIILYYLIFALIRNARLTVMTGNILIYLAAVINYLVYLFRGNPILPSDLLAWRTGMSVADNYQVSFTQGFLTATLIMISMYAISRKLEKTERKPTIINRVAVVCTFMIFTGIIFHWFFDTDLIKSKIRVIDFFAPKYTYCTYGTVFGFVANVEALETSSPEGYSADKVAQILDSVPKETTNADSPEEKPNIIVIMNEAFSDLSLIGNYTTNMDYLANIRALKDNTIKGKMFTSVFGGATSDTEYEFLTGDSMAVMPSNCVPYQQFVTKPRDSLAKTLKDQGYYNIAIHPYKPSGYKRDLVYPLLGFDEFLSMKDFTNPQIIRSYISDRSSYAKIIEEYEKNKDKGPMFIFNVTMQNHGGYSSDRIFSDEDTVKLTGFPSSGTVEQYLSLLRESDKAFQSLIDYFKTQKKHTIILLFGDHQPVVYSVFHDLKANQPDEDRLKYQVPFVMWANYDIPKDNVDQISANFLSSYLLKTAGLKGTSYNDYLMELYKEVPVINAWFYIDKDNQFHKFTDDTPYHDLVMDYKYVGYNDALDKKDKLDKYFYLK